MKTIGGKFIEETMPFVLEIKRFIEKNIKVEFEMVAGDFVKDEGNTWWFLNLKSFKLTP